MATRVRLNRKGVRELLRSTDVEVDLERRAANIADAAGDGFEIDTGVGKNRARAAVYTDTAEAMLAEAKDRALTRAIDAGRT